MSAAVKGEGINFNEQTATDCALARLEGCEDPRIKEVLGALIRHTHAFVREVEPNEVISTNLPLCDGDVLMREASFDIFLFL